MFDAKFMCEQPIQKRLHVLSTRLVAWILVDPTDIHKARRLHVLYDINDDGYSDDEAVLFAIQSS